MHTIDFLNRFGLDALCERFAIRARRHAAHPHLVQLRYRQALSPMAEPIVQECRGVIVDESDGWRVVGRGYDKFFNYGEPNASAIDWSTAKVCEKLDGSLTMLYRYAGEWHVASSGVPDGGGSAGTSGATIAQLFRRTWHARGYRWPDERDDGLCFVFELMAAENRVVLAHSEPRIVLHGVRKVRTGRELEPEPIAAERGWACARAFPMTCLDECIAAAQAVHPMEGEGHVVRDGAFRRVKIKSPRYVALAHLKEGMTGRRLLEMVRANESDEFLTYFPELRPAYDVVRRHFDALCDELEEDYRRLREIPDQKSFAAAAGRTRCSSPLLFLMRAGKCGSVREFFASATIQSLERAIEVDLGSLVLPGVEGEDAG